MNAIGVCGDNCEYCPRYIATKSGNVADLEEVKQLWVRLGLRTHDTDIEEMKCQGCLPENKCAYTELRACVEEKALENCGLCDMYPCQIIARAFDKTERLRIHAVKVCTEKEFDKLHKAFFSKREYFDQIHQGLRNRI